MGAQIYIDRALTQSRLHLPWGVGEEGRGGGSAVAVLLRLGGGGHHVWGRVLHFVLADATQHLHGDGL